MLRVQPGDVIRRSVPSLIALLIAAAVAGHAPASPTPSIAAETVSSAMPTTDGLPHLSRVLTQYVDAAGQVNYRALSADPGDLHQYVDWLARLEPETLTSWSRAEQMAFWINVYNALTLRAIIDHYPIEAKTADRHEPDAPANSIRQIAGVRSEYRWQVAGRSVTLDQIAHGILRKRFRDPRVHMALVCGTVSCPPLRNEPYLGSRLDQQLDEQTRRFLASGQGLRVGKKNGSRTILYLSPLFKWYIDDFAHTTNGNGDNGLLAFLRMHGPEAIRSIKPRAFVIRYLPYNWELNEQR